MSSKSKRIGTTFESAVASYLTEAGIPCRRVALAGVDDQGDLRDDNHQFIIECKGGVAGGSASRNQLKAWLEETETERLNAGVPHGFLVTKTAGKGAAQAGLWQVHIPARELAACWGANVPDGYATITLDTFIRWWQARP